MNMSKHKKITIAGLVLILVTATVWLAVGYQNKGMGNYPIDKNFKWRYKLVNTRDVPLSDVSFSVFSPYPITANQTVTKVDSDKSYTEITDSLGNQLLRFTIPVMAPHQSLFIDLKAALSFSVTPQDLNDYNPDNFLNHSSYIESEHPKIIETARKLKKETPVATTRANYDWVRNRLEYTGYIKEDRGALYALEHRKGDCTEYAYLLTALLRASQIPARVIGGYVYPESSVIRAQDYHNWVEVFFDNQWHIVDPQKGRFLDRTQEYLAFRIIDDSTDALSNSHQIIISDKNVKVSL